MGQASRIQVLGGLLHRLGNYHPEEFSDDFSERLIIQKTIYLMQSFDLFVGYHFNWYLRGPYSPALTKDAYDLINTYEELPEVKFVASSAEGHFTDFISFIGDHISDDYWLEAMASIHYLYYRSTERDQNAIFKTIRDKMPTLKRNDFDDYWETLGEKGLIGD